jgi:hypothetical protein
MKICHEPYLIPGISVGNGFTDPINMVKYSDFVYQLGLVETNTYREVQAIEQAVITAVNEGRLVEAFMVNMAIHNLNCGIPGCRSSMSMRFLSLQNHGCGRSLGKI